MIQKSVAAYAALLMCASVFPGAFGQTYHPSAANSRAIAPQHAPVTNPSAQTSGAVSSPQNPQSATGQNTTPRTASATGNAAGSAANSANPAPRTDCYGGNCDFQPPHISIATPAPAPAPWQWQQRVLWGAILVLVVLGYIAILIALSLLRKIERQTEYAETAADAAKASAETALAHLQALVRAERPWVLMSVRPAQDVENGFTVVATNRGRGPARILSMVDEIVSTIDEAHLPPAPEYRNQPVAPADPTILLPSESTEILSFSRADVERVCETAERFARVEKWEEKIFLYGTVVYQDLAAHDDAPPLESSWLCWYIHGRQKSGMVMVGTPAYNRHS